MFPRRWLASSWSDTSYGMAVNRCLRLPSSCTGSAPLVAVEGDIVTLNWKCFSEEGEVRSSFFAGSCKWSLQFAPTRVT